MLKDFIVLLYKIPAEGPGELILISKYLKTQCSDMLFLKVDVEDIILYCERFFEFLIDLEAQLVTRRFFNALLDDHQIVTLCRMAPFNSRQEKDVELLKQQLETLAFYAKFEINDVTGMALTDIEMTRAHSAQLTRLQHIVFRQFRQVLPELPLANHGSIQQRDDLLWHFNPVSVDNLAALCEAVDIRSEPIVEDLKEQIDRKQFLIENLIAKYEKRVSQIEKINAMPLYPDEVS